MTKHFRKEHPSDLENEDYDDGAYSDAEASEDEPSLDQDTEDSREQSQEISGDGDIKLEIQQTQGSNTYSTNLWALPGQGTQQSLGRTRPNQLKNSIDNPEMSPRAIKLERSVSRTPQRTFTDPSMNTQAPSNFMHARSNTLPQQISIPQQFSHAMSGGVLAQGYHQDDAQLALWHATRSLQESPTSMTNSSPGLDHPHDAFPSQNFQLEDLSASSPISSHYPQQQDMALQAPSLQAVHDIMLDEPQPQYTTMTQSQQQSYTSMPQATAPCQYDALSHVSLQQPQYQGAPIPQYHQELPPTPAPAQQLQYAVPLAEPLYQEPQLIQQISSPVGHYFLPQNVPLITSWDFKDYAMKDYKDGDTWSQLPNQSIPHYGS